LNENAAYMDRLLLHTGISLENEGEKEQAKKFYQAIVDAYPGTSSAKVAKKRLR
jgi:TolA-binding protein